MKKYERYAKRAFYLALFGIVIMVVFAMIPPFNDWSFNLNTTLFANYGTFIGGLSGSILLFSSIILLYVSLLEQRKSVEMQNEINTFYNLLENYNTLVNSIEAFPHKHEKPDLQFIEYLEGSENINHPNMQLVNCKMLAENLTGSTDIVINLGKGRQFLNNLYLNMKGAYTQRRKQKINDDQKNAIKNLYTDHLRQYGYILKYYLNFIFNVLEFIDNSKISNVKYGDIFLRALASREIMLAFYWSLYQEINVKNNYFKQILLNFNIDKYIDDKDYNFNDTGKYSFEEIKDSIYFHPEDKKLFFNDDKII